MPRQERGNSPGLQNRLLEGHILEVQILCLTEFYKSMDRANLGERDNNLPKISAEAALSKG